MGTRYLLSMTTILLSLLACAPSDTGIDSQPASDTGALEYAAPSVAPSHFQCDEYGTGLADIPPDAYAVSAVHLEACDGEILGETRDWSLSATRIIVDCGEACGGEVVWAPGE